MRWMKKTPGIGYGHAAVLSVLGVAVGAMSPMAVAGDGDCVVPTVVGSHEISDFSPTAVVIEGSIAYVSMINGGMDIFDVSDPSNPVLLSTYSVDVPGPYVLTYDVAVSNQTAYVAINGFNFKGIRVVDVSQPEAPLSIGLIETGENIDLVATSSMLFSQFDLSNPLGIRAFDMSDPTSPSLVQSFATLGDLQDLAVDNDRLYISDGSFGFEILDASDVGTPSFLGFYSAPGFVAQMAAVGNGVAYVVSNETLHAIDVSVPATPSLLGTYDMGASPRSISVVDSTVYVLFNSLTELRVLDASDPAAIVPMGTYDTQGVKVDMAVEGSLVYLLGGNLQIIDVTNTCADLCDNAADMNNDGAIDFFDVSAFLQAFAAEDPIADFIADGVFNNFDLSVFLAFFQQGCP